MNKKPLDIPGIVKAAIALCAWRDGQKADLLVITDCRHSHTACLGGLAYRDADHDFSLAPLVTRGCKPWFRAIQEGYQKTVSEPMNQISFRVDGMDCASCAAKIDTAVSACEGCRGCFRFGDGGYDDSAS